MRETLDALGRDIADAAREHGGIMQWVIIGIGGVCLTLLALAYALFAVFS